MIGPSKRLRSFVSIKNLWCLVGGEWKPRFGFINRVDCKEMRVLTFRVFVRPSSEQIYSFCSAYARNASTRNQSLYGGQISSLTQSRKPHISLPKE